ncbi:class I SAM-dependent DNA methyltransferase [Actinoallomurus rhizosphaericola]|uniref:class I SAM-dependent DNA methyltransferase n=1 Tax=Actinoallomurus rhizosphaericola TaxID=2952536 RepID=UPI0020912F35|nr:class I SAM-dependent methyltransferase [Actinoallomurus rhizosphaericola]MCO5994162.1 class I SAM-dependent methyltransferase [Actinoallomurus rhizosphaericola]
MVRFADFDTRGYRMVDVRTGYGQWVSTYEETVEDVMDLALLDRLTEPAWGSVRRAVDLGCGTGRTAAWLRRHGVTAIDGVDLTPEMLAVARSKGGHDRLFEADVTATGLDGGTYDLVIASLIDEHLADLEPFYAEAWRLAEPGALCVIVAFHPHFIMAFGMPTHFTSRSGEPIAISTHVHLLSDHVMAGVASGWRLVEMREGVIDDRWLAVKPKWERYRNHPISAVLVWRKEP